MPKSLVFIAFFFCSISVFAQKDNKFQNVDKFMLKIPDSSTYTSHDIASYINSKFSDQKKKARAAFFWVTENITYDYSNKYNFNKKSQPTTNKTLAQRKGICGNYTLLLKEILVYSGIKTYIVGGYTRKGKQVSYNPHAWCISQIDSVWYFTDPTFGSGHMFNEQFVKKRNDRFFMVSPKKFIKTHIPFDPLWQFLNYPISKNDFVNGREKPLKKTRIFSFLDTLKVYEKQNKLDQLKHVFSRTRMNGIESYLDYDILVHYQQGIDNLLRRSNENEFIMALDTYNSAIFFFNKYIDYSNNYFKPYQSDEAIMQMLNLIEEKFELSKIQLDKIESHDPILTQYIENQKKLVNRSLLEVNEKKKNLEKYLEIAKQYRERLSRQKNAKTE